MNAMLIYAAAATLGMGGYGVYAAARRRIPWWSVPIWFVGGIVGGIAGGAALV